MTSGCTAPMSSYRLSSSGMPLLAMDKRAGLKLEEVGEVGTPLLMEEEERDFCSGVAGRGVFDGLFLGMGCVGRAGADNLLE